MQTPYPHPRSHVSMPMRPLFLLTVMLILITIVSYSESQAARTMGAPHEAVALAAASSFTRVAAGAFHTCALTNGGGIKCWGVNWEGGLGDGTTTSRLIPVDVTGLSSGVTAITSGYAYTCALTNSSGAKCWGRNDLSQLGDGSTTNRWTPVDVTSLSSSMTTITAGGSHTCTLTSGGGVKCWGYNYYGELGDASLNSGVTAITAGQAHTCALMNSGGVKCWGFNASGQLGDGTQSMFSGRSAPVEVSGMSSGMIAITANFNQTCALTSGGGVKCWGANGSGELGDGSTTDRLTPVDVIGLNSGVTAITAGGEHTCALMSGGGVKCWGRNDFGELGDGSTTSRLTPVDVVGLSTGVTAITAGYTHTCALMSGGGIKCWGYNRDGQLGDGTTTDRWTPVDVVESVVTLPTPTNTATPAPTDTATPTATATSTATPTATSVPLPTATATATSVPPPTATATPTSVPPPTATALPTPPPSANPYEPNDTCAQAGLIAPDGSVQQHTFATSGDTDWVRFDATSGTPYRIEVQIPATSPADVALELYAQCGGGATTNQDYTFAPGVRLDFTAPASGPLFLKLVNHTPATAGPHVSYDLSVRAPQAQATGGALILVAGRLRSTDQLQANIHAVTNAVYARFTEHGYTTDRITYLATDLQLPGVDALASRDNLRAAITQWARDKVGPDQALTLYLMDHGSSSNGFYLDEPRGERLTPAQLAGWIAELEAARPGVRVNIIIEACYSGTFVPALSKAGRVVITSTGSAQSAYASPQGAFFSDQFVSALGSGSSLYLAFQQGRGAVLAAQYAQSPTLDDNGNGQANDSGDGAEAQRRGFAFAGTFGSGPEDDASWPPYISEVQVTLDHASQGAGLAGTGSGQIRARVQDNGGVHSVWAVIYPPDYQPPAPSEGLVRETLPTVQLLDQGAGWYAAAYPGFTAFGGYRVAVFADDRAEQQARPAAVELQTGFRVFVPLLAR